MCSEHGSGVLKGDVKKARSQFVCTGVNIKRDLKEREGNANVSLQGATLQIASVIPYVKSLSYCCNFFLFINLLRKCFSRVNASDQIWNRH